MKKKSLSAKKINHNLLKKILSVKQLNLIFKKFEKKLNPNKNYLIAVSGGSDSLALAFLSKCFEEKYNLSFSYCIVDHQLRKESSREAKEVVKILNTINIKCNILKWTGKKPNSNIQSIARFYRYELLEKKCFKDNINDILLGHHSDDLNENFFIRMTRGSGLKGLVSLGEKNIVNKINYIRPLLDFNKKQLKNLTLEVFKKFIEDPSNNNTDFKRIRIRNLIKSLDGEGLDIRKLNLTIMNLKKADYALDYYSKKNIEDNSTFQWNSKNVKLSKNFFLQPEEVIFRSLNKIIQKIGNRYYAPRGKSTSVLIKELKHQSNLKNMTLGGCLFKKINETIIISKERG